jgi:hypothetical protein
MKNLPIILILAVAVSACGDLGVPPSDQPPPLRGFMDDFIYIGVIPGIHTTLHLSDSSGTIKTAFASTEPVFMRYSVINGTGYDQTWATGMSNPFARFFVVQGSDTLADSFAGKSFLAIPFEGTLKAGDSLVALWRCDPPVPPLSPGGYSAIASPVFGFVRLGVPGDWWRAFVVTR